MITTNNILKILVLIALSSQSFGFDVTLVPSQANDDSDVIQAAANRGGVIRFSTGIYRLRKTVEIDLAKTGLVSLVGDGTAKIVMEEAGPAFRWKGTHNGTADPGTVAAEVWRNERMPVVSGLEFTGSHADADAMSIEGTMQFTASKLLIHQMRHGLHLKKRNRNILIADCHIYNNSGVGIYYDAVNLHQSNISACHISYNRSGGVVIVGGDVRNVHIDGCDIEANMAEDKPHKSNIYIECTQGSGAEIAITGCTIQHTATVANSANIVFFGSEKPNVGEEVIRWGHLTIADNILTDAQKNIWLKGVRGGSITGNSFGEGHEYHLLVEDCRSLSIASNVLDRNPPYYVSKAKLAEDATLLKNCKDITLVGNLIQGVIAKGAALRLVECEDVNVSGCSILDCPSVGLGFVNCRECLVTGCLIRDRVTQQRSLPSISIEGGEGIQEGVNKLSHGTVSVLSKKQGEN